MTMIRITRIVDKSVLDKVDIDRLREVLPEVDREVALIVCVTKQVRKEEVWEKGGVIYIRVVLDYNKILMSNEENVIEIMKSVVLEKLNDYL